MKRYITLFADGFCCGAGLAFGIIIAVRWLT